MLNIWEPEQAEFFTTEPRRKAVRDWPLVTNQIAVLRVRWCPIAQPTSGEYVACGFAYSAILKLFSVLSVSPW